MSELDSAIRKIVLEELSKLERRLQKTLPEAVANTIEMVLTERSTGKRPVPAASSILVRKKEAPEASPLKSILGETKPFSLKDYAETPEVESVVEEISNSGEVFVGTDRTTIDSANPAVKGVLNAINNADFSGTLKRMKEAAEKMRG